MFLSWLWFNKRASSNWLLTDLRWLYELDSNVNDSSSNSNDGTASSFSYNTSDKKLWSASGDCIASGTFDNTLGWESGWFFDTWTSIGSNAFSYSVRVKPDTDNKVQTIISNDANWYDNSTQIGVCVEGTTISTDNTFCVVHQHSSESTRYVVEDTQTISTTVWTHFVYTYDGTTMRLYTDWVEVDTTTKSWLIVNTNDIKIWRRSGSSIRFYNWLLDSVGLWIKALTATQVSQLYNSWSWLPYADFTA